MAVLEFQQFSKTYPNGRKAVDQLTLSIEAGDCCAFIGHNGAGKTTSLRAAAGILPFDGGSIRICGTDIKTDPVRCKQQIAYLPDNPDLYTYLTARQYLYFIADMFSVPDRDARIAQYAAEYDMESRLDELIGEYSHGMKQKIAIISAFLHAPTLLLLDEPFVGLDPSASFTLKKHMRTLCEQGGAVFFSTHVLEVAQKLCNRVAIIRQGALVAQGDTEDVCGNRDLEAVFLELEGEGEGHNA